MHCSLVASAGARFHHNITDNSIMLPHIEPLLRHFPLVSMQDMGHLVRPWSVVVAVAVAVAVAAAAAAAAPCCGGY